MFKKFISLIMVFILILSVGKLIFAADDPNAGKIRLGSFVVTGLETNDQENTTTPEWFTEYYKGYQKWQSSGHPYEKIAAYSKDHPLYVSPEQAEQITILFSDPMVPLMFTPEEIREVFADFAGIEYLKNLQSVGTLDMYGTPNPNGINGYPFSKEQIREYYKPLVEAFRKVNAKELWPHLNFDTLRSNSDYPYDMELRGAMTEKINQKKNEVIAKINNSDLSDEEKTKLKEQLEAKVEEYIGNIKTQNAYDLSIPDFESDFEKKALVEFGKIDIEIRKLEKINISVRKVWSDNSNDKEVTVKLLKKKADIAIDSVAVDPYENGGEIDIEMRSMPEETPAVAVVNSEPASAVNTAAEETIPDGYEFVTNDAGQALSVVLNKANNYTADFTGLHKYEKDGNTLIEYKVYEMKVDGYRTQITGNSAEGFVITNTKEIISVPNSAPDMVDIDKLKPVPVTKETLSNTDIMLQKDKVPNTEASDISKYALLVILLGGITATAVLRKHKAHR